MKEYVLEQIVDDYLQFQGYFTTHNVKFRPDPSHLDFVESKDSGPSDIDVLAYHPRRRGPAQVLVVSSKAWQRGFSPTSVLTKLRRDRPVAGKRASLHFRELWIPKCSDALHAKVRELTGVRTFTYLVAVVGLREPGTALDWEQDQTIRANLRGCSFGFLQLEEMWPSMYEKLSTAAASSEIGRLLQLLKAAGLTGPGIVAPPSPPEPGSVADIADETGDEA